MKLLSVDIETTGLDFNKNKILCIGVTNCENGIRKVYRDIQEFNDWITGSVEKCPIIGHNFKFDLKFLIKNGADKSIRSNWGYCTQSLAHLSKDKVKDSFLEEYEVKRSLLNKSLPIEHRHREGRPLSLKVLAPYFLKVEPFWETAGNYDNDDYVLKDCEYTERLAKHFLGTLNDYEKQFNDDFIMPALNMLLDAELRGIAINMDKFNDLEKQFQNEEQELRLQLDETWNEAHRCYHANEASRVFNEYEEMGKVALEKAKDKEKCIARYQKLMAAALEKVETKLNYDSPKQMLWLLRDFLELPVETFEGEESTGVEVLERLANNGREDIKKFLRFRQVQKIIKSYFKPYRELIHEGRIHATFNMNGTRTGRLSSSDPNLQQVPDDFAPVFSPSPGMKFIKYDYAGIEAVLIALYSEDPVLFDIIKNGWSIHDFNTKLDFNLSSPISEIKTKFAKEREVTKHLGFARFYGAGKVRMKQTYAQFGIMASDEEIKSRYSRFREKYKKSFEFHQDVTSIFEGGGTINNLMGRPITIQSKKDAYMKGFNTLVQSSASDLCIKAAVKAKKKWQEAGLNSHILVMEHDSILAECQEDQVELADKILRDCMLGFILKNDLGIIPLNVEGGISDVWE